MVLHNVELMLCGDEFINHKDNRQYFAVSLKVKPKDILKSETFSIFVFQLLNWSLFAY